MGFLDVTKAPYKADPSGAQDSTEALQKAVNDARDFQYVCFFPSGTYLISKTLSCEQTVSKMNSTKTWDGKKQSYAGHRDNPCILIGSKKGTRPVIKLKPNASGFGDRNKPQAAVWMWAQTRDNAPGKNEPSWGTEQPSISFNNIFRGIDIVVRGNAGAVGIRHAGSQGSTLEDVTIHAEGAYAGMLNCPGQGGGTYNLHVIGGEYGIVIRSEARFAMLAGVRFEAVKRAGILLDAPGSYVLPVCVAGFSVESTAGHLLEVSAAQQSVHGVTFVDGIVSGSGAMIESGKAFNLNLRNVFTKGFSKIRPNGPALVAAKSVRIREYADSDASGVISIDGKPQKDLFVAEKMSAPPWESVRLRHVWRDDFPSWEDADAVSVKTFGAKGDGQTDDTDAIKKAIAAQPKIFIPRGVYIISDTLELGAHTSLFGAMRIYSELRAAPGWGKVNTPVISTVADASAVTRLADLSITFSDASPQLSLIHWRAGTASVARNLYMKLKITAWKKTANLPPTQIVRVSGGGRFFAVNGEETPFGLISGNPEHRSILVDGSTDGFAWYAPNVERNLTEPQMEIRNSANVSLYYHKAEAGTTGEDSQTMPLRVSRSTNVAVYCSTGNIVLKKGTPCIDIVDSQQITITQVKSFKSGEGMLSIRSEKASLDSTQTATLFILK